MACRPPPQPGGSRTGSPFLYPTARSSTVSPSPFLTGLGFRTTKDRDRVQAFPCACLEWAGGPSEIDAVLGRRAVLVNDVVVVSQDGS
ncbi:uncharacterized protein A4U43_C07F14260, partial [Asparagus officinalis]